MRCIAIGTGLLLALTAPAITAADEASVNADVRCLVIGIRLLMLDDQTTKAAGQMTAFYYFGRLDGASLSIDLEDKILNEVLVMTPEVFKAEGLRCAKELQDRGLYLQKVGANLAARGKKMDAQSGEQQPKNDASSAEQKPEGGAPGTQ